MSFTTRARRLARREFLPTWNRIDSDDKGLAVTVDFQTGRLNFEVDDVVVTAVTRG